MATLRALLVFIAVIFLAAGVTGFGQGVDTGSGSFGLAHETTDQTAVFMTFMASFADAGAAPLGPDEPEPDPTPVSTAVLVSNPLAWDPMSPFLDLGGYVTEGTVEVYLWDAVAQDLIMYETSDDSVGRGLNPDGTLPPGGT